MSGKYSEFIFNFMSINSAGILSYLFFNVFLALLTKRDAISLPLAVKDILPFSNIKTSFCLYFSINLNIKLGGILYRE